LNDKVPERNNDFKEDRLEATHQFLWGRDSELYSRVLFRDRRGFNPFQTINWTETADIYHTENWSSETRFELNSAKQNFRTTTARGSFRLRHELYNNLTTTGRLLAENTSSDLVTQKKDLVGLAFSYRKSDFKGVNVRLALGGDFSYNDRDSRTGLLDVVDESHIVPANGVVILRHRFAIQDTILVTDSTASIVYSKGVDYRISTVGDGLTQLFVLPAGNISTGEVILISYKALILPSVKFNQFAPAFGFVLGYKGFSISYFENQVKNYFISGFEGSILNDIKNSTARAEYVWDTLRTSTQISAERRVFEDGDFRLTTDTYYQSFSVRPSSSLAINLFLTQSFSKNNTDENDLLSVDLSLSWKPWSSLSIRPQVGAWKNTSNRLVEMDEISDKIISYGLYVDWVYRKLSVDFSYYHNDRVTVDMLSGTNDIKEDIVRFNLRRRFR
jgi:hypothetical protein